MLEGVTRTLHGLGVFDSLSMFVEPKPEGDVADRIHPELVTNARFLPWRTSWSTTGPLHTLQAGTARSEWAAPCTRPEGVCGISLRAVLWQSLGFWVEGRAVSLTAAAKSLLQNW